MRKFMIVVLSLGVIFFIFLARVGDPIDRSSEDVATNRSNTESDAGPVGLVQKFNSSSRDHLAKPGEAEPSSPIRSPSTEFAGNVYALPLRSGPEIVSASDPDARIAELWRLADLNMEQFYAVLWQALEEEDPDDAHFREFVLATLERMGDADPGEILAALIETAPTEQDRMTALRSLAEASQELSVDPFRLALEDEDPQVRASASAFHEDVSAQALLDAVAMAVLDGDSDVRLQALSTLEEMSRFAPIWHVADSIIEDADPDIRMHALELSVYGDRQFAEERLQSALNDPDPQVSDLARTLLIELEQESS